MQAEPQKATSAEELSALVATYRRGSVPRELRRRQVLAHAGELFVERGYSRASMDELARRVGVSKPLIYGIGGSKEQLFRDVMTIVDQELTLAVATAVAAEVDPSHRLRAGILAFLHFVQHRRAAWNALLTVDSGPATAELAKIRRTQAEHVTQLVLAGLTDDTTAPDPLTASALARAINGAAEFIALWWQDHPEVSAEALANLLTGAFSPNLLELSTHPLVE